MAGAWSTHLYVTAAGAFDYTDEFRSEELDADHHWFGELSLWLAVNYRHKGHRHKSQSFARCYKITLRIYHIDDMLYIYSIRMFMFSRGYNKTSYL